MPKLSFSFSSMNSGKSLMILTRNYSLVEKGFVTVLMKPIVDDRTTTISTRLGIEEQCILIEKTELPSTKILNANKKKPDFVLIDEAQFLTKAQVYDLSEVVDNWEIDVYAYGLKLDWQGNFFEGSLELFKFADELIQVETFCRKYKRSPALFHIKTGGTDDPVETGYEELYDSVSRKAWKEWNDTK